MTWLIGPADDLPVVAAKVVVMYVVALIALRVGERRTLAQWTIIDFAAAVAIGAIVGRTAVAQQSVAVGATALVALVAVHRVASLLRFNPLLNKLADHRVRVLVVDGQVRVRQLRLCGLTDHDLFAELRRARRVRPVPGPPRAVRVQGRAHGGAAPTTGIGSPRRRGARRGGRLPRPRSVEPRVVTPSSGAVRSEVPS